MHNLRRSRVNRIILGVCGGLGQYFKINPWIFRLLFIVLCLPGLGLPALVYLILGMAIPEESRKDPFEQIFQSFSSYSPGQQPKRQIKEVEKVKKED